VQPLDLYKAIAEQYRKFDFRLERCLMTRETIEALKGDTEFLGSPVETAQIDAMWFSRPSGSDAVAWEIRLVSSTPVSLLEKISNAATEDERSAKFREMESRLSDLMNSRRAAIEEIIAENAGAPDDDESDDEEDAPKVKGNGRYK